MAMIPSVQGALVPTHNQLLAIVSGKIFGIADMVNSEICCSQPLSVLFILLGCVQWVV